MLFEEPIKIESIEDTVINKANNFAHEVVKTINYSDSKQINTDKIIKNYFIGKLGEEAVCLAFNQLGIESYNKNGTKGPDYTIYDNKNKKKSWGYDLIIKYYDNQVNQLNQLQTTAMCCQLISQIKQFKPTGISVRTQAISQALKYGYNWAFQSIEGGRKDPILSNPNALVCFVECNDKNRWYDSVIYPPYQISELKFEEPDGEYFKGIKKFVKRDSLPYFGKNRIKTEQVTIDDLWK